MQIIKVYGVVPKPELYLVDAAANVKQNVGVRVEEEDTRVNAEDN